MADAPDALSQISGDGIDLVYVSDTAPGITRRKAGKGFVYHDADGGRISGKSEIERINALAVPPAYRDVWICPLENGHIQATGIDEAGRKQYRYHPGWREVRDAEKFAHLAEFGTRLPRIRRAVRKSLRALDENDGTDAPLIDKNIASAALVRLLDRAPLRIGSWQNKATRGATTLLHRNIAFEDGRIDLDYKAKGGKKVHREINDQRLIEVLSAIDGLPGKPLFQYVGTDGEVYALDPADVNQWLKDRSGSDEVSAKVFRTWSGTMSGLDHILKLDRRAAGADGGGDKPTIKGVCEAAADMLKNTPAITRSSYVHPAVIALVEMERAARRELLRLPDTATRDLRQTERRFLALLERLEA